MPGQAAGTAQNEQWCGHPRVASIVFTVAYRRSDGRHHRRIYLFQKASTHNLTNHLGMFLDLLLFPRFQSVSVDRPIFIMGHPRSGTTLLHRTLTRHSSVMSFKTWEIFFPALIWRRPLFLLFGLKGKTALPAETGHSVTWDDVEEEELLLLHLLDTQMASLLTPLGFSRGDLSAPCLSDSQPHAGTSARFLKRCFQRQIWWTDRKNVIARMNYSLTRMNALRAVFLNARFIFIYREPIQAIASHLSLHRSIFIRRYQGWRGYPIFVQWVDVREPLVAIEKAAVIFKQ